jgi:chromosomal replication initiator protein
MKRLPIFSANYIALPGLKPGVKFFGSKSVDAIISVVCKFLDVKLDQVKTKSRKRHLVVARQIAMYLIKKHTTTTFFECGQIFGGRDHTTAIHSVNTVKDLCFSDEIFKQRLLQIENLL